MFIPRPSARRTAHDLEGLLALLANELHRVHSRAGLEGALWHALQQSYEAGIDAQRALVTVSDTDHGPTPAPSEAQGTPVPAPRPRPVPRILSTIATDLSRLLRLYREEGGGETE